MGRLTMSLQMVSCIKVLDHVIFKMELLSTEFFFFKMFHQLNNGHVVKLQYTFYSYRSLIFIVLQGL